MGTLAAGMKEIFSSAQTTATHLPTCSSDGTPTGRISTSDIASVLGVNNLRKQISGNGKARWYRVAKTSNNSTIGGIIGYVSFENVTPLIFSFVMMKYGGESSARFKSICGNQDSFKQYFRYKNTTNGICLWIRTTGDNTNNFIIPTLKGTYSSFDIVQETPPEDALEPNFD